MKFFNKSKAFFLDRDGVIIKDIGYLKDEGKIIYLPKRNDDIEKSLANIKKIFSDIKWKPKTYVNQGINRIIKQDYLRLKKIKLVPADKLKSMIKNFNKKL